MRGKTCTGPAAYKDTTVNYMKTQAEIGKLLAKHGICDIQMTTLGSAGQLVLQFMKPIPIDGELRPVGVRIAIPGVTERNRDQYHRMLLYHLKTKFEAVEFGLLEFTEEFLPHLVIPDGHGGTQTVYDLVGPQYKRGLISGRVQELRLLPGGGQ